MRFLETLVFTRTLVAQIEDEAYRSMQLALITAQQLRALRRLVREEFA